MYLVVLVVIVLLQHVLSVLLTSVCNKYYVSSFGNVKDKLEVVLLMLLLLLLLFNVTCEISFSLGFRVSDQVMQYML